MINTEFALIMIGSVMLVVGWILGENIGINRYFKKRNVGTIVYVDKDEETVTIQFNSEDAIHEMKHLDHVVFEVKSLD